MVDDKEMRLVALLVKTNDYVTAQELADQLNVSPRTIMRIVKRINTSLDPNNLLIKSESGKGYRLNYQAYLTQGERFTSVSAYSPTERRNEVLLNLLFRSPNKISISKLFQKFYVSEPVINVDLAFIKRVVATNGLELKNQDNTVRIIGNERRLRRLIISVINKLEITDYDMLRKEFPDLSDYDLQVIIDQIDYIEKKLQSTIPFPYNINLFSHLYILIKRYRQGSQAHFQLEDKPDADDQALIANHPRLYSIATTVVQQIADYLSTPIPEIEKFFVFQYLSSSRLMTDPSQEIEHSEEVDDVVSSMIAGMSVRLNLVGTDAELRADLASHVQPMLNRMKQEISISNPLLIDIRTEYPQVFEATREVVDDILRTRYHQTVSDDEVGFITLYFAKHLEQHKRQIHALIMCSSGVGTSELLRVKVQRSFPKLIIDDVISLRAYEKERADYEKKIDLIITTIRMDQELTEHPVLLVNAMFNRADQERVQKTIEELSGYGK